MTPEQALQVLVSLAEAAWAPKSDHLKAEQAKLVLAALIAPPVTGDPPVETKA